MAEETIGERRGEEHGGMAEEKRGGASSTGTHERGGVQREEAPRENGCPRSISTSRETRGQQCGG
jgi:hypothetical protein